MKHMIKSIAIEILWSAVEAISFDDVWFFYLFYGCSVT